jgi:hypothetical protein
MTVSGTAWAGWIEALAEPRVARQPGALEHPQHLALDQLDALDDVGGPPGGAGRGQGAIEVVEHREQVAEERFRGELDVVLPVTLGPAADVVGLGQRAEEAVLLVLQLAAEPLDLALRTGGSVGFGGGARRRKIVHVVEL